MAKPSGMAMRLREALDLRTVEQEVSVRRPGPAVLLNPRRLEVLLTAAAYPGIHLRSASRLLLSPLPTLRFHVRILADEGLLVPRKRSGRVLLFPFPPTSSREERFLAAWQDAHEGAVLRALRRRGWCRLAEIAKESGRTGEAARRILGRLLVAGAILHRRSAGGIEARLSPAWQSFEKACRAGQTPRLKRILAILDLQDLHPELLGIDGGKARIAVDGPRSRVRFILPLNPVE